MNAWKPVGRSANLNTPTHTEFRFSRFDIVHTSFLIASTVMSTSSFDSDDEDTHMLRDALRQMQALPPSSLDLAPGWNLKAAIRANVHDDDFFYDSSSETPYLRELPVPWAEDGYFSSQELEMES